MARMGVVFCLLSAFASEIPQDKNCYQKLFEFTDLIDKTEKNGPDEVTQAIKLFRDLSEKPESNNLLEKALPDDNQFLEELSYLGKGWKDKIDESYEILFSYFLGNGDIGEYPGLKEVLAEINAAATMNNDYQALQNSF